jgi:hypothetical protein
VKRRPFRWGYPGLGTPYASVFRLPPNCELSLIQGTLQRFFPKAAIPERVEANLGTAITALIFRVASVLLKYGQLFELTVRMYLLKPFLEIASLQLSWAPA